MTPSNTPAGTCGYAPNTGEPCGAPAVHHFIVIGDTMNYGRFACRSHGLSAAHGAADYHRVGDVCGQAGTRWVKRHEPGEGFCYREDDPTATAAAALHETTTLEVTS